MSEVKGQLLGIVLVLMVFAAVSGLMVTVFTSLSQNIEDQVDEVISTPSQRAPLSFYND